MDSKICVQKSYVDFLVSGGISIQIWNIVVQKWFRKTAFCRFDIVPINFGYRASHFPMEILYDYNNYNNNLIEVVVIVVHHCYEAYVNGGLIAFLINTKMFELTSSSTSALEHFQNAKNTLVLQSIPFRD